MNSDKLSFVDLNDGKTYVYNGAADAGHKQEVASRAGEKFIVVTARITGTGITSAQYGSYTMKVSAGALDASPDPENATDEDILYIYKDVGKTGFASTDPNDAAWGTANFLKEITLGTLTVDAASVDQSYVFIVAAKGLDVAQNSHYKSGSLTISATAQ